MSGNYFPQNSTVGDVEQLNQQQHLHGGRSMSVSFPSEFQQHEHCYNSQNRDVSEQIDRPLSGERLTANSAITNASNVSSLFEQFLKQQQLQQPTTPTRLKKF